MSSTQGFAALWICSPFISYRSAGRVSDRVCTGYDKQWSRSNSRISLEFLFWVKSFILLGMPILCW